MKANASKWHKKEQVPWLRASSNEYESKYKRGKDNVKHPKNKRNYKMFE